jgi:hypothetical protein
MPLTEAQEILEHELIVGQMRTDIELEMAQRDRVRQDWRLDPTRVIISAVLATAAIMGAAGGLLGFLIGRGH